MFSLSNCIKADRSLCKEMTLDSSTPRWNPVKRKKKRKILSSVASKERITRANEERRTMRPSLVLTARIKTNAIWARIIRNCLLSLASRYIPSRFDAQWPASIASVLFKLQLYAAQKAEKLQISIEA